MTCLRQPKRRGPAFRCTFRRTLRFIDEALYHRLFPPGRFPAARQRPDPDWEPVYPALRAQAGQ